MLSKQMPEANNFMKFVTSMLVAASALPRSCERRPAQGAGSHHINVNAVLPDLSAGQLHSQTCLPLKAKHRP
jgi:hypothetical protein